MPLRVGLVGYGLAGSIFHAPLVSATEGMDLVSVVTADPVRQAGVRERYPRARILASPQELWQSAADHDLVVIASPTGTHVDLGLAAIEAGLPVVIDKPLATSAADGRRLADVAQERGAWVSVFHNRRWDGETLTAARLLSAGAVGAPLRFESRFERWRPQASADSWREQTPAEGGGGLLLDLGSHLVDQALFLFGRALRVYAEIDIRRPGNAAEDDVFIALAHAGGVRSHLWTSSLAADLGPSLRLLGREAAYVKQDLDGQENDLRSGKLPGAPHWGEEPAERWGRIVAGAESRPVETVAGNWPAYYAGVRDSLAGGGPPPVPLESAMRVLEVLDAARESSRTRQVVIMPHPQLPGPLPG